MQKDAGWNAALREAAGVTNWRGPAPPVGPPAAPQAAAEGLRASAAPPNSSRPRRRATTATSLRARAALGVGQLHQAADATDLDGIGAVTGQPTVDDGVAWGDASK